MFRQHTRESKPNLPRLASQYPATELPTELPDIVASRREDYLDRVLAPLTHLLPFTRRQELRLEMQQHLDAMISAYQELGEVPEKACDKAFAQFGKPEEVADSIKKSAVYPTRWQRVRAWWSQPRLSAAGVLPALLVASALYFGMVRPTAQQTMRQSAVPAGYAVRSTMQKGHVLYIDGVQFNHRSAVITDNINCGNCHRPGEVELVKLTRLSMEQAKQIRATQETPGKNR